MHKSCDNYAYDENEGCTASSLGSSKDYYLKVAENSNIPNLFTVQINRFYNYALAPADGSTDVFSDTNFVVTFDTTMDASTITVNKANTTCSGTFQLSSDDFSSCVIFASDATTDNNVIFTMDPSGDLILGTYYKALLVNKSIKDSFGFPLLADYAMVTGMKTWGSENAASVVYSSSTSVAGGASVTIVSAGDSDYTVWLAPSGTTTFTAGSTMTSTGGDDTSIIAPANDGVYRLYIVNTGGNVSNPSAAMLTVDATPPNNQNTVFATSWTVSAGADVTIDATDASFDSSDEIWFAPSGTTVFETTNPANFSQVFSFSTLYQKVRSPIPQSAAICLPEKRAVFFPVRAPSMYAAWRNPTYIQPKSGPRWLRCLRK